MTAIKLIFQAASRSHDERIRWMLKRLAKGHSAMDVLVEHMVELLNDAGEWTGRRLGKCCKERRQFEWTRALLEWEHRTGRETQLLGPDEYRRVDQIYLQNLRMHGFRDTAEDEADECESHAGGDGDSDEYGAYYGDSNVDEDDDDDCDEDVEDDTSSQWSKYGLTAGERQQAEWAAQRRRDLLDQDRSAEFAARVGRRLEQHKAAAEARKKAIADRRAAAAQARKYAAEDRWAAAAEQKAVVAEARRAAAEAKKSAAAAAESARALAQAQKQVSKPTQMQAGITATAPEVRRETHDVYRQPYVEDDYSDNDYSDREEEQFGDAEQFSPTPIPTTQPAFDRAALDREQAEEAAEMAAMHDHFRKRARAERKAMKAKARDEAVAAKKAAADIAKAKDEADSTLRKTRGGRVVKPPARLE